ncbi:MAG: IS630 family transposase [Oscillochloris sp.]|nr:IS630 family transposase [Oscillochloris sp.]
MAEHIRAAVPPDCALPVEIHCQDEARFGLKTTQRRRITARGVTPIGIAQHRYANTWLYGTVAPASGDAFTLILPKLNTTNMQIFIDAFAAAFSATFNVLVLDNRAVHTTERLRLPANVALVFLPPYSPELNPVERLWQELRARLAWLLFDDLDTLEAEMCTQLDRFTPAMVQSLTRYPYLRQVIDEVGPFPHAPEIAECSN